MQEVTALANRFNRMDILTEKAIFYWTLMVLHAKKNPQSRRLEPFPLPHPGLELMQHAIETIQTKALATREKIWIIIEVSILYFLSL